MDRQGRRPPLIAALVVAAVGTATGLAAAARVGPFDGVAVATHTVRASVPQPQIAAGQLYPTPTAPPTTHQIIEIHDPARVIAPATAPQGHAAPVAAPIHEPTPKPTVRSTPSATNTPLPCPEDCGGGDG